MRHWLLRAAVACAALVAVVASSAPRTAAAPGDIETFAGGGVGDGSPATSANLHHPSGVAVDAAGNLYIADTDNCRVRKVSGGTITTVAGNGVCGYNGDGGAATRASLSYSGGVAVDSTGNLYVADTLNCRIRWVSGGTISTVAGDGVCAYSGDGGVATAAHVNYPQDVAVDGAGNLYIADSVNCRVRRVSSGTISTVAGDGHCQYSGDGELATSVSLSFIYAVALDAAGDLYFTDTDNCRVRKVSGGIITTVAGNGFCDTVGDGGPATAASLLDPRGVAVDGAGDIYIADYADCRVRKVSGGTISAFAGSAVCDFSGDGAPAALATFYFPFGLAVNGTGDLYIADSENCRVRKVSGGIVATVAGNGFCLSQGDGGSPTSMNFILAHGVALDSFGDLYIADRGACRIRKVSNGSISTIAGNGTCGYNGDGGTATTASIYWPEGVAVNAAGVLYIADTGNCRVRRVSGGTIVTVAGNGVCGYIGDGVATGSGVWPYGVAVDSARDLYIADYGNCRVRKVSGATIATIAGNGMCIYAGDGGPATEASLKYPYGMAVDGAGDLYIADSGNCRVRKLSGGTISTVAGTGALDSFGSCVSGAQSGDGGAATAASLYYPVGVALDGGGSLYITESCRVRKVSSGTITTVAGTNSCGYSGDGGPATSARFNGPSGVVLDAAGSLYVADYDNLRVRKVSGAGYCQNLDCDGDGVSDVSDNCLYAANGGQANSDSRPLDGEAPPGSGTVAPLADATNPHEDAQGDACDPDDDNDGLADYAEFAGCNGSGALDPLDFDSDHDLYPDGYECAQGTNPSLATSRPPYPPTGATDSDGDGLLDAIEIMILTFGGPANFDGDPCSDRKEQASVNGDSSVTSADLAAVAMRFGPYRNVTAGVVVVARDTYDFDRNGIISSGDLAAVAQSFGSGPAPGAC